MMCCMCTRRHFRFPLAPTPRCRPAVQCSGVSAATPAGRRVVIAVVLAAAAARPPVAGKAQARALAQGPGADRGHRPPPRDSASHATSRKCSSPLPRLPAPHLLASGRVPQRLIASHAQRGLCVQLGAQSRQPSAPSPRGRVPRADARRRLHHCRNQQQQAGHAGHVRELDCDMDTTRAQSLPKGFGIVLLPRLRRRFDSLHVAVTHARGPG